MKRSLVIGVLMVLFVGALIFGPRLVRMVQDRLASFSLPVPFTVQAPTGNWENNQNCEEASAIMANAYLTGYTADMLTARSTQESIDTLVRWEEEHLGQSRNNGVDDIAQMIEEVFELDTAKINDFTEDDLKNELLQRHVLIIPVNMQLLGNPEYAQSAQVYHVVVIRGYTSEGFLVHDPGLTSGKDNLYSFATLHAATADWDREENQINPVKVVLSVSM